MGSLTPVKNQALVNGDAAQLEITAPVFVVEAKKTLARTEDCKFSPNGQKLAVAGFAKNKIIIFDIEVVASGKPAVSLTDYVEIHSPLLNYPHGLDFVDDSTLVIANRGGSVTVFEVPSPAPGQKEVTLAPLLEITKASQFVKLNSPGSVAVSNLSGDNYELVVCNNYTHRVTHHKINRRESHKSIKNRIMLEKGLKVPDGVSVSASKALMVISNHLTHEVFIYDNTKPMGRRTMPQATLKGLDFPHGLRFVADDRFILVADAGLPFMKLYHCPEADWKGDYFPVASIRIMDDETFLRGHYYHQEGGLKGLDLSPCGTVLATTCETQPLVLYDVKRLFSAAGFEI